MANAAGFGDPDFGNPFAALNEEWARLHPPRPAAERLPWHRNTRLLTAVIAVASVALAVSAALLLAGEPGAGREQATPGPGAAVPGPPASGPGQAKTPAVPAPLVPLVPLAPVVPPVPADAAGEAAAGSAPAPAWAPPSPAAPAPPTDAAPEAAASPESQKRPRTNVTRTPMSFAPGEVP